MPNLFYICKQFPMILSHSLACVLIEIEAFYGWGKKIQISFMTGSRIRYPKR